MNGDFIDGGEPDFFHPDVVAEMEADANRVKDDSAEEARRLLRRRQEAYTRVFAHGTPMDDDVAVVMTDLAAFCRGYTPTFHPDPRVHALLEGRREVFLRIMDFTRLDNDALFLKYTQAR